MARYIHPYELVEDTGDREAVGTTASPQPCSRPTGQAPQAGLVGFAASIRRIGECIGVIAITLLIFFALPMIFGGL